MTLKHTSSLISFNRRGKPFATLLSLAAACLFLLTTEADAAGPGLPNLSYSSTEVFKPLSIIKSTVNGDPHGEGNVQMVDGYLFVPFGKDSGVPGGGLSFYDISNPRAPRKVSQVENAELIEPHGFGFTNGGRYAAMSAIKGVQFWDFSDVLKPTLMSSVSLPGIQQSPYELGVWWSFWQAPYVYVGGAGNGLYIVNAADPRKPVYVKTIPASTWGGFRIGAVYAVGNLLVVISTETAGMATLDISDPVNPRLIAATSSMPGQYSGILNGDRIISAGIDNKLYVYDIANPAVFKNILTSADTGGRGGYVSIQGGFAHAGFSTAYFKINLSTGAIVGSGTSGITNRDEDFGTVLGNLVMVGNDHDQGSAIFAHQTGPMTLTPAVNMVSPKAAASNVATTSRVGITTSTQLDIRTVSTSTFIVRPVGGTALAGSYSGQSGILNFAPSLPLAPGTTYEVVVPAGGMKDDVGNGVAAFSSTFTTAGSAGPRCTLAARTAATLGSSVSFAPATVSGTALQYSWSFGDGSNTAFSTDSNAVHTYALPRHHPVILTVKSGTATGSCSANQTIYTAPTATAPRSSGTIAFDAARNRVWAVNSDANTVTAINSTTNTVAFEVAVGINPQTLAQAPDGRIWVTNFGSDSLSVLDPATGALVATVNLGRGSRPFGVVFNPLGTAAYVSLHGLGSVVRLNPGSRALEGTLTLGPAPRGLAITGDSSRLFVTRYISPVDHGEVIEVNPSAFTVTRTFALATDPGPDTEASGRGVPNFLSSITIQPDGKRAWIPSKKDNTLRGSFRDGLPLTFESTVRTIVSQISLESNAEVLADRVDLNDRDLANVVAFSPRGDYAFISTQGTNEVEVIDAYTRQKSSGLVNLGRAPRGMLITPNGRLYVQSFMSRSVSVFDVNGILESTSNVGNLLTTVKTVANEPLSAQVLLGKQIFYNADDRRMNRDRYISCASCHQDGGHDGRVMDFTDRGEGFRNTTVLNGKRGTGQGRVHWTGNFDEIQDFEHDIRNFFGGTGFMSDAQFNTGTRNQPLGNPKSGVSPDLDALAAYVGSLATVGPSPFRNADGSLTAAGVRGQTLFRGTANCIACHSGPEFTNSSSGQRFFVGTTKPSSGKRSGAPLDGLDTPTLKGVWDTAPYLHDGSAATLLDVLTTANTAGRHGATAGLSSAQLNDLVAYLQQIDDSIDPGIGLVISGLSVKDTANAGNWASQGNLQVGNLQYGDRSYTFTSVPAALLGSAWLRTANLSRSYTGTPLVSFTINQTAEVYVAIDDRIAAPAWMAGWTNTGLKLLNSTTPNSFTLYQKQFVAGAVSLGPLNAGGVSMYTVIVK